MKAKITKGFNHLGRRLNLGDEIDEDPGVVEALVQQGYAEAEEDLSGKPVKAQPTGSQQGTQTAPGNQQSQQQHSVKETTVEEPQKKHKYSRD